ncbi:ATP-dependent RNA helicase [Haematobacter genomosp. 1]|uniref:ATP-dependent RNA helicase n=1 Tax=Haematobacter genomosp. 1 TaxID=366618 RepID=A0A212AFE6_9RHOB|nr:ATP-dependent RNA helicase [Haematobacter genomosp. 1]
MGPTSLYRGSGGGGPTWPAAGAPSASLELGHSRVKQSLLAALDARGYSTLTPVQEAVTEPSLRGLDLLVSAQTGSGKTVGFGLAIAPTVLGEDERFGIAEAPLALVIAPTRELALQVKRELEWLYAGAGAVLASCVGGMDMRGERRALERGVHILVATPGRLCDHLRRGSVDLSAVRAVVLDEADEMLDLGFREDLETILEAAPEDRQTLLFSATVPRAIATLASEYQRDAQRISVQTTGGQHSDIDYRAVLVAEHDEENAITNLLRFHEAPNTIIFANTRAAVSRLVTRLSNRGFAVVALSGELSQGERSHALQSMRDGRARVCVATDVAARGIDLPNLDLVIHAELPMNEETLLHRSGRTGRAGRKGFSALIVPPRARRKAERLLAAAKLRAEWEAAPSADAVRERDESRLLADPVWAEEATEAEGRALDQLLAEREPAALALAVLRLWQGQRSAPEELLSVMPRNPQGQSFGPSRWFRLSIGRDRNANPKWLMPKICDAGGVTRKEIGAIRIGDEETFVEIALEAVEHFLATLGPDREIADGIILEATDGVPDMPAPRPRTFTGKPGRQGDKPFGKPYAKDRPYNDERPRGESDKPYGKKPFPRERSFNDEGTGERKFSKKPAGEDRGPRSFAKPRFADKDRPEKPYGGKSFGGQSYSDKPLSDGEVRKPRSAAPSDRERPRGEAKYTPKRAKPAYGAPKGKQRNG